MPEETPEAMGIRRGTPRRVARKEVATIAKERATTSVNRDENVQNWTMAGTAWTQTLTMRGARREDLKLRVRANLQIGGQQ